VTKPYLVWLGVQQWREEMVGLNEGKTHVGTEKILILVVLFSLHHQP
jgi:hypothetical protein